MGLNSPRISAGASGFMSNVSRWEGPPFKKMTMHDFAFPKEAGGRGDRSEACAWAPQQFRQRESQQTQAADTQQLTPAWREPSAPRRVRARRHGTTLALNGVT